MRLRRDALATAVALSAAAAALTLWGCESERFTGNGSGNDAGAAGNAGSPASSGGSASNGEGGASNAGNQSGAANSVDGSGNAGSSGEGGAAGESSGEGGSAATGTGTGGIESTAGATSAEAGHGGAAIVSPVCDPAGSPVDEPCVVDETYGVFVSPSGSNERGNGSRERPYATIARAVAAAVVSERNVYVCADDGAYTESVNIDVTDGLALYGGFSCADWSYDTKLESVVASTSTRALHVSNASRIRIEDFRFQAVDATVTGDSSIAAWVMSSSEVTFVRSVIQAGRGANGAHGGVAPFSFPAASSLNGNSATRGESGSVAAAKLCTCQNEELASTGGAGGPPGNLGGTAGLPDLGGGEPGPDGADTCRTEGPGYGVGRPGADGERPPPSPGATSLGLVNLQGWHPAAGQPGIAAGPGQGGGGGSSLVVSPTATRGTVSRGGGGGCGGCGGNGGGPGRGGGASIALLVLNADVTLWQSALIASDAGDGGIGHPGQDGQQQVGRGGGGVEACSGGSGGRGGRGGVGGGGAGGISAGIVWSGTTTLTRHETTIQTGAPGAGGHGGESAVNKGIDGAAHDLFQAPP